MPKPEKVRNPNAVPTSGDPRTSADPSASSAGGLPNVPGLQTGADGHYTTDALLSYLNSRGDGYLRIVGASDGEVVYYKYKYTNGHSGSRYCMFVDFEANPNKAVRLLTEKVWMCDEGAHVCSQDKFYQ